MQDVDPDEGVEEAARRPIGERGVHLVEEILCADEATAIAVLHRSEEQTRREPRLPHACGPNKHEVLGLGDEIELAECPHLLRVDAGLPFEGKRFDRPLLGQLRLFDPPGQRRSLSVMRLRP